MIHRVETFRTVRGIVVLQSLKVSHLSNIPNRCYEAPKLKNWMCELCTFSQIQYVAIAITNILLPYSCLVASYSLWCGA